MFERVKKATVALAWMKPDTLKTPDHKQPFIIMGSGFCIHPKGIVVTCRHVMTAFMNKKTTEQFAEAMKKEGQDIHTFEMESAIPHVLFYETKLSQDNLVILPLQVETGAAKTDFDLAMLRLHPHSFFKNGFPHLEVEDYSEVHEGLDAAICGFPLGNYLADQVGTITSSFTRGIVSSILPVPGTRREYLKGFQLNIAATNGNSGGPVFSMKSGKVFGVLSEAVTHPQGFIVQGLTKAEPIYPILGNDLLQRMLDAPPASDAKAMLQFMTKGMPRRERRARTASVRRRKN
jgi:hypothetical protein